MDAFDKKRDGDSQRFWAKVDKSGHNGCWVWTAALDRYGYGRFQISPKTVKAHRFAYEDMLGPIPGGLPLDHLCRNPSCVNPDHLEPVTHRENIMRGLGLAARNARATHCIHGHEFTPENTYRFPRGTRACRTCQRANKRNWKIKKGLLNA